MPKSLIIGDHVFYVLKLRENVVSYCFAVMIGEDRPMEVGPDTMIEGHRVHHNQVTRRSQEGQMFHRHDFHFFATAEIYEICLGVEGLGET